MTTYIYLRVSTNEQDIDNCLHEIIKYCNFKDLIYNENNIYRDLDVSGRISYKKRKIYDIINKLNKGDHVVVSELSRLSRNMIDSLKIVKSITKIKKSTVHLVKNHIFISEENADPTSVFNFNILASLATMESDQTSQRIKTALNRVNTIRAENNLSKVNELSIEIQKSIVSLYNEEFLSINEIATKLNISYLSVIKYLKRYNCKLPRTKHTIFEDNKNDIHLMLVNNELNLGDKPNNINFNIYEIISRKYNISTRFIKDFIREEKKVNEYFGKIKPKHLIFEDNKNDIHLMLVNNQSNSNKIDSNIYETISLKYDIPIKLVKEYIREEMKINVNFGRLKPKRQYIKKDKPKEDLLSNKKNSLLNDLINKDIKT